MTFYEAALRVLESAGRPLHIHEITEQSIAQNLLSHVGKAPDKTMLSRLAAMARRTRDRRVVVTAKDTFGLAEWSIPENPEALAQTGLAEPNPEEALPPLRSPERHPDARVDNVRATGRADRRRKHEEEDESRSRRRRFPPIAELAFEILSDAGKSMKPNEIAERARERELASAELGAEQILTALLEDNQRRIDVGRRPQFVLSKETGELTLERGPAPLEQSATDVQSAFAEALGIPFEGGRPVFAKAPVPPVESPESVFTALRATIKDARRSVARELRRRLAELDIEALHKAVAKVLQALSFRELKVAKRSRDGLLLTARKRDGSTDLRFAIRLLKGTPVVDRRVVQELRRDLNHYAAQVGLIACPGELRGDGRAEAQSQGPLTMVWCAEALGEKFLEAKAGVLPTTVEIFEFDERFFSTVKIEAEEAARRRDERLRQRQSRDVPRPSGEAPAPRQIEAASEGEAAEGTQRVAATSPGDIASAELLGAQGPNRDASEDEQSEEGDEGDLEQPKGASSPGEEGSLPGDQAERKRRRRRRRGRRGRGRPVETSPAPPTVKETPSATAPESPADPAPMVRTENETP